MDWIKGEQCLLGELLLETKRIKQAACFKGNAND